jgi:hypothetical protein
MGHRFPAHALTAVGKVNGPGVVREIRIIFEAIHVVSARQPCPEAKAAIGLTTALEEREVAGQAGAVSLAQGITLRRAGQVVWVRLVGIITEATVADVVVSIMHYLEG